MQNTPVLGKRGSVKSGVLNCGKVEKSLRSAGLQDAAPADGLAHARNLQFAKTVLNEAAPASMGFECPVGP